MGSFSGAASGILDGEHKCYQSTYANVGSPPSPHGLYYSCLVRSSLKLLIRDIYR